jgi:hypothetical protein
MVVKGWLAKSYKDHAKTSFLFLILNMLIVITNTTQFISKTNLNYPIKNYTFAYQKYKI